MEIWGVRMKRESKRWFQRDPNAIFLNHPTLALSHRVQKTVQYMCLFCCLAYNTFRFCYLLLSNLSALCELIYTVQNFLCTSQQYIHMNIEHLPLCMLFVSFLCFIWGGEYVLSLPWVLLRTGLLFYSSLWLRAYYNV